MEHLISNVQVYQAGIPLLRRLTTQPVKPLSCGTTVAGHVQIMLSVLCTDQEPSSNIVSDLAEDMNNSKKIILIATGSSKTFWRDIRKASNGRPHSPTSVDDCSGQADIVEI